MEKEYFNKELLKENRIEYEVIKDYKNLSFNFKRIDNFEYFFVSINNERLNCLELKSLLNYNQEKNFLCNSDKQLINYLIHKLSQTQAYYKIINDIDLIFSYLINTSFNVFYYEKKVKFSKQMLKLDLNLILDDNQDVILEIKNQGKFFFGLDKVFFLDNQLISLLDDKIPKDFYKEIIENRKKFSIDNFLKLKNTYLEKLKKCHNLKISKKIEKLEKLEIDKKKAKKVLQVDKTKHFIIVELVYKVKNNIFKIADFKYLETRSWLDKKEMITISKEDDKLIKYTADLDLSEDVFEDIFKNTRINYRRYLKEPFKLMIPIFQLNNFIEKVIPNAEKNFEIDYKYGQKLNLINQDVEFNIESNFDKKIDLFEFSLKFKIADKYFDIDFMKNLMLENKKYIQLADGVTINVNNVREINKWIEFLKQFNFVRNKKIYQGDCKTVLEIDKFLEDFKKKKIKSNDDYKKVILELKEKKVIPEIKIPKQVNQILRNYQKEGIYWIYFLKKYGFGGILADEMGLGKTLQAITAISLEKTGTSIVICPKTLIYNWENEVNKYFPDLKVLVIDGDNEKRKKLIRTINYYDIVITSYSMLQKDYQEYIDLNLQFNYSVLDEAHYVKNVKTLSAKAVRLINYKNILLLTGTPLENNLDELYGTFDLVMPNFLGNKQDFRRDFVSKIERNNLIALEILQAKIRPFILRRTKKEVLKELPDKQEQIVLSEMTNKQVGIYNEVLNRVRDDVNTLVKRQGFEKSRIQILSALLKLRQICNHPSLIDKSFLNENDISGKYNQFLELVTEVIDNGDKVLVFSQFTSMLDIFEKDLAKTNIEFLRLDGSTKNRQKLVDDFNNNDSIKVFLISLKAGGVGLNLTSASAVFLYDPWWNPMVEQQAKDRAHRLGQKKTVNVYKFITKNSIEEKILKLQERKGNLFENLVNEDNGFIKKLEWEDLMELFE